MVSWNPNTLQLLRALIPTPFLTSTDLRISSQGGSNHAQQVHTHTHAHTLGFLLWPIPSLPCPAWFWYTISKIRCCVSKRLLHSQILSSCWKMGCLAHAQQVKPYFFQGPGTSPFSTVVHKPLVLLLWIALPGSAAAAPCWPCRQLTPKGVGNGLWDRTRITLGLYAAGG